MRVTLRHPPPYMHIFVRFSRSRASTQNIAGDYLTFIKKPS